MPVSRKPAAAAPATWRPTGTARPPTGSGPTPDPRARPARRTRCPCAPAHLLAGRCDQYLVALDRVAVGRLAHPHPARPLHRLREQRGETVGHVLHDQDRRAAVAERRQHRLQCLRAAGRSADRHRADRVGAGSRLAQGRRRARADGRRGGHGGRCTDRRRRRRTAVADARRARGRRRVDARRAAQPASAAGLLEHAGDRCASTPSRVLVDRRPFVTGPGARPGARPARPASPPGRSTARG